MEINPFQLQENAHLARWWAQKFALREQVLNFHFGQSDQYLLISSISTLLDQLGMEFSSVIYKIALRQSVSKMTFSKLALIMKMHASLIATVSAWRASAEGKVNDSA